MSHTDFCHNCLYFPQLSTIFCPSIPLFDQFDDNDVLRINLTQRNMQIFRYFRHFRKTSVCDIFSFWRFFEENSVYHRKNYETYNRSARLLFSSKFLASIRLQVSSCLSTPTISDFKYPIANRIVNIRLKLSGCKYQVIRFQV